MVILVAFAPAVDVIVFRFSGHDRFPSLAFVVGLPSRGDIASPTLHPVIGVDQVIALMTSTIGEVTTPRLNLDQR